MKYFWTEAERKKNHTTCCFEFQKGKYSGKHWFEDSICLYADIFDEMNLHELFSEAVPKFDYFGPNEVTKEQWQMLLKLAHECGGTKEEVVIELKSWVEKCFEEYETFTICGI